MGPSAAAVAVLICRLLFPADSGAGSAHLSPDRSDSGLWTWDSGLWTSSAQDQETPPAPIELPEPKTTHGFLMDAGEELATGGEIMLQDAAYFATAPLRPTLSGIGYFVGGAALVGGAFLIDEKVRDFIDDNRNSSIHKASRFLSDAFEPEYAIGFSVGLTATSYLIGDEHLQRTSLEIMEASAITELLVAGIKNIAGRSRPRTGRGADDWDFFGGTADNRGSFPSGHTAAAFSIAAVVGAEYPGTVWEYGAYGLAGLVGLSRMELDAHWTSDVVTSVLLSQVVGRTLVWLHRQERFPSLAPWLSTDDGERVAGASVEMAF